MRNYKQSDMLYSYRWSAAPGDNPKLRGEPDSNLFNRSEGYEVLYIINKFMNKHNLVSVASGNKAEKLIHDKLPSHTFTQLDLMTWLANHW